MIEKRDKERILSYYDYFKNTDVPTELQKFNDEFSPYLFMIRYEDLNSLSTIVERIEKNWMKYKEWFNDENKRETVNKSALEQLQFEVKDGFKNLYFLLEQYKRNAESNSNWIRDTKTFPDEANLES